MRMQPCDAYVPIDQSSLVPWMPIPSPRPMKRAFSGLSHAPPGIVRPAYEPAHGRFGAVHAGLTWRL